MKKKIIFRLLAAVLITAMVLPMAAGCRNDSDNPFAPPEFVFVAEYVNLPDDIIDIGSRGRGGLVYSDGRIIFVSSTYNYDDTGYSHISNLYTVNIDGTGYGELPGYVPPVSMSINASEKAFSIGNLNIDNEGNLWVIENWTFVNVNIPDGHIWGPNDDYFDFVEDLGSGNALRKLDPTGRELLSIDLSELSPSTGNDYYYFYIESFETDNNGNIYLSAHTMEGSQIIVLDSNGNLQFRINPDNYIDRLFRLKNGSIAFIANNYNEITFEFKRVLQLIDYSAGGLGEEIEVPSNIWDIFPASGDYDFLYSSGMNTISGFNVETGESTRLINWIDSDVVGDNLGNITMMPDGRILVTNGRWNNVTYEYSFELILLTKTPYSELPKRTVISLATFDVWSIRDAVIEFNRTNPDYRIQVADYSEFNNSDDWNAGLTRLSTEIISGRLPDILDVSALPYKQYAGRGLLEDLYGYIDADPNISRSDLLEGAFKAAEIDGGLYQIFPSFSINTLIGSPKVLGPGIGWTMDEFQAMLAANPQADYPLGYDFTRLSFIQQALRFSTDEYVNWSNGTTHFDTPNFISLLEFANTLPESYRWDGWDDGFARSDIAIPLPPGGDNEPEDLIAAGRQLMAQMWLGNFYNITWYKQMFGGEIVYKGFPTDSRNGNSLSVNTSLAMAANSKNKEGAWEFLKVFLDKDWQLNNAWGFLTNRAAFDAMVEREIKEQQEQYDSWLEWRNSEWYEPSPWEWIAPEPMTQADVDQLLALIDSTSGTTGWNIDQSLLDIVSEGAEDFFGGRSSAADVARIIQSRASILVSERS